MKLARAIKVKPSMMKKAAGQELISWSDASELEESPSELEARSPDNILPFQKSLRNPVSPLPQKSEPKEESAPGEEADIPHLVSADFILWQRELSRDPNGGMQTKEAVKGYSKATEMYVVKTPSADGKDKIRFASTQGVLVNKKQA